MPLREYQCTNCNHKFEILESMELGSMYRHCLECGGPSARLVSQIGQVFYRTAKHAMKVEPIHHNSKAMAQAATAGYELAQREVFA